jgi:hypothetical protein
MTSVQNTLRNVWADMVRKRLWPVAVALVLALIAIPVVLAKPAPKASAPPQPVAGSTGPAPLVTSPASIRSNASAAPVDGKFHDPFKQQHKPKAAATAAPAATGGSAAGGGSGSAGGGGSGGSSGSGGSKHKSATVKTVTKLRIRFGKADGKRTVQEITPGTALPTTTNPLIVFLGFTKGDKGGRFLVSSDVTKTEGDGTKSCEPSQEVCSELKLEATSTQFFDLGSGDQYQLDVLEVVTDAA